MIEGVPVQLIPAYNPLVEEAVEKAKEVKYKRIKTRVLQAEYLLAIMLQTDRPKDRTRIVLMLEEARINARRLASIVKRHGLSEKWSRLKKQVYGT